MNIDEEFRFDVRIQERMVKKGLVQKDELDQRLSGLKDLEEESEPLDLQQPGLAPLEAEAEGDKE
jgi:hypothetical protein